MPTRQGDPISQNSVQRGGAVIVSTRAAAGIREDEHATIFYDWYSRMGYECLPVEVVPDGPKVQVAIQALLNTGARLIVTSGGTGLTPDDQTPEQTKKLLEREVPGIMEAIRAYGVQKTPLAALSRGYAGVVGDALVVNLPGSQGGILDGLTVLEPLVEHALAQITGSHEH